MNLKELTDEELAVLTNAKKINGVGELYTRYRNYGYSITISILKKSHYYNALNDEADGLVVETIYEAIKDYDKTRGSFRSLFVSILNHKSIRLIRKFSNDGLSNYISIDAQNNDNGELLFMDSNNVIKSMETPNFHINSKESIKYASNIYHPHKKRIQKMIEMKDKGYSYQEIANRFSVSVNSIRQIFYRLRKTIHKKESNKLVK